MMDKKLTFNEAPELYEKLRPTYPEQLIEDVIKYSALTSDSEILEIGPGTGQITFPFAKRGYPITGIEIGKELYKYLQKKLMNYSNANIINSSFEEWEGTERKFDLVISAQAFHWIDPETGYPKVARLLKEDGHLALIWIYPESSSLIDELNEVYLEYFPNNKKPDDVELRISKQIEEIQAADQFDNLKVYKYPFEIEYTSSQYTDLLETYSDHRIMDKKIKLQLYNGIKKIINKAGGKITKSYVATLYLIDNIT